MQMYLGGGWRSSRSKGPCHIAGLLGSGSPNDGSKWLSYKLSLDINIQKTSGPALAQVKTPT